MSLFTYLVGKDASVDPESVASMDEELAGLESMTFGAVNNCAAFQNIADGTR